MSDPAELHDHRPHWTGRVTCIECMHVWVAVVPLLPNQREPSPNLCCPNCSWPAGIPTQPANKDRR